MTEAPDLGGVSSGMSVHEEIPDRKPRISDMVLYRLGAADATNLNRRFSRRTFIGVGEPIGASHNPGQLVPMVVTSVQDCERGIVSGQILVDGNISLWTMGALYGDREGSWQWPEA